MNRYDDDYAPTHADTCYYCAGDSPVDGADHEDTRPCDAIGHQYGTASEDHVCYGCGEQATDPAMIDPLWHEHQERAYRAADFFDQARAAHDDIAAGAYPSRSPILLAPLWRNGTIVAEVPARIVGVLSRAQGAYFVEYLHAPGETAAAFGYRMRLV